MRSRRIEAYRDVILGAIEAQRWTLRSSNWPGYSVPNMGPRSPRARSGVFSIATQ